MHVSIASTHLLIGKVRFVSFEIPQGWRVRTVPHQTETREWWVDDDGKIWAIEGYIRVEAVSEEAKLFGLYIKVERYDESLDFEEWSSEMVAGEDKELSKFDLLKNVHEGAYVLYKRSRRKFWIFGDKFDESVLKVALKCDKTNRTIFIEVRSLPNQSLDEDFVDTLLSSVECH